MTGRASLLERQFEVLREVHHARDFRLVLCVDVFDCMVEYGVEKLGHYAKAGLLPHGTLIVSERRSVRTRFGNHNPGWSRTWTSVVAAAL